jgi:hypothetical protein
LSDTAAPADPRPKTLRKDVEVVAEGAMVISLGTSFELNVYDHLHNGHIVALVAWTVGLSVPLLVAFLAHMAAHVNYRRAVQVWIFAIASVLMYVSASAGTRLLTPGMGTGPALAAAVGLDLAALTALGTLMHSAAQKAALAGWEERQEARRLREEREAREQAERAEREELMARFGRPGNSRGNAAGNSAGNAAAGNTPALQPGNAGRPELAAGGAPDARVTGPLATVTDLTRRPSMADDEMWALAMTLADDRERVGLDLTVRAFMDEYGGTPKRVAPLVKAVKEARAAAAGQNAAGE